MKQTIKYVGYWGDGNDRTYIERIDSRNGNEFRGSVIRHGFLSAYPNKQKGWFRVDKPKIIYTINPKVVWEPGTVSLDIKKEITETKLSLKSILREFLYDREDMPQVDDIPEAVKELRNRGIKVQKIKVKPSEMKPSQKTLDYSKVKSIAKKINPKKHDPIVIAMDDHIVDGHHRWEALRQAGYGNDKVSVYRIMLNRQQAIQAYKNLEIPVVKNVTEAIHLREEEADEIIRKVSSLKSSLAAAAQKVYDEWEQDDEGYDEMYGVGGICDDIADKMSDVLTAAGLSTITQYNEYDYHTSAYVVDHDTKSIVKVDIPPGYYETGAAYQWKKIPDVEFTSHMVHVEDMSDVYDEWYDEDGEWIGE